ncbi:MAG: hypothetical protein TREMPRED_002292 [Tremellales sp. Tagirdzhanova-0007]|nr:MAG: hypothetical protein TREMPRED_002292 [Tremellales sp. Tagirdzhanova-0007]
MASTQPTEQNGDGGTDLSVPFNQPRPILIIVMGPASCGKSTIGRDLSHALSLPFLDGDTLHPQSNIDKMSKGVPLTDDDRLPWLALIRSTAERICKDQHENDHVLHKAAGGLGRTGVIIACSALKKWYRDILRGAIEAMPPEIHDLGHFMGAKMLESQLATLEDPQNENGVTTVEIDQKQEDVARHAETNIKALVREEVEHLDRG